MFTGTGLAIVLYIVVHDAVDAGGGYVLEIVEIGLPVVRVIKTHGVGSILIGDGFAGTPVDLDKVRELFAADGGRTGQKRVNLDPVIIAAAVLAADDHFTVEAFPARLGEQVIGQVSAGMLYNLNAHLVAGDDHLADALDDLLPVGVKAQTKMGDAEGQRDGDPPLRQLCRLLIKILLGILKDFPVVVPHPNKGLGPRICIHLFLHLIHLLHSACYYFYKKRAAKLPY